MTKRRTGLGRDLRNSPAIFQDVLESPDLGMPPCVRTPDRRNAACGTGGFDACMAHACASSGQVAGCAGSAGGLAEGPRASRGRRPAGGRLRATAGGCAEAGTRGSLEPMAAGQPGWLRRSGTAGRGALPDAAAGTHPVPWYDKKHGAGPARPGTGSGTHVLGRRVAIRCPVEGGGGAAPTRQAPSASRPPKAPPHSRVKPQILRAARASVPAP